jgi:hypothetical protein
MPKKKDNVYGFVAYKDDEDTINRMREMCRKNLVEIIHTQEDIDRILNMSDMQILITVTCRDKFIATYLISNHNDKKIIIADVNK